MEIILKQDVELLGSKHDTVTVKSGYARNFLIPKGMAVAATPSAKKVVAEVIRQQAHKAAKAVEEAQALAKNLEGLSLEIGAKAGETGKIFGSVNSIQIAEAIQTAGYNVDRKVIKIEEDSIKQLGDYEAILKLHKEVNATVKFKVIAV
ncbi:MAG TPA: 50S ribosomal protein L9 [Flavobacteriales bacterium]|nr:50S ribosomal protein L9 [Flavobacteriales bacterium]|tara:strand:- start:2121 stop:2567 length:447 start_codon:yes stop_codon:yes gene_type:complete